MPRLSHDETLRLSGAPNPRRVKIFAEEKNITLELINCDMKREHKSPESKKIPAAKFLS